MNLESGKQFQFDWMKENEDFVVLNSGWQQVLPTPSMIQHLPSGKRKAGGGYIHPCERFSGEVSEGNSSLFIELLLARLTAERGAGNYDMGGYGVKTSLTPGVFCEASTGASRQKHNAEVAHSTKLQ